MANCLLIFLQFAARKCANLSGDIRKAFHMCKVAAETVFEDYSSGKRVLKVGSQPIVSIADVQKGSKDLFSAIVLKAVSCSTDYEALLLISLGALKRARENGNFEIKEILTKIESIANSSGDPRYISANLSFADVLGMLNRLGDVSTLVTLDAVTLSQFQSMYLMLYWHQSHLAFYASRLVFFK